MSRSIISTKATSNRSSSRAAQAHQSDISDANPDANLSASRSRSSLAAGQCVNGLRVVELVGCDSATLVYSVRCLAEHAERLQLDPDRTYHLRELYLDQLCERQANTEDDPQAWTVTVRPHGRARALFAKCLERFQAESRTLAGLKSVPGLVQVVSTFEANGTAYRLSDQPLGQSLESRIQSIRQGTQKRLSTEQLSHLLESLLGALDCTHKVNVLHRNINPSCIYLSDAHGGELDGFFAAGQVMRDTDAAGAAADTGAGEAIESRADTYASIELNMTRGNQGCWSDLYALGASLYEAVALTPPAHAKDRFQRLQASQSDLYVPLRVLLESVYPARLLEAIDWMLKANIRNRPKSVKELRDFLGFKVGARNQSRGFGLPGLRKTRRTRTLPAAAPTARKSVMARSDDGSDVKPPASPVSSDQGYVHAPLRNTSRHLVSMVGIASLAGVVIICAGIYVNYAGHSNNDESGVPPVADASAVKKPEPEREASSPVAAAGTSVRDNASESVPANSDLINKSNEVVAGTERRARRTLQRPPLTGEQLDRFVDRHLKQAERAWRAGHLLVPARGSVLRHLEFIMEADPASIEGSAGIDHLLFHFLAELQKAESAGDAAAIRYLNRNIRRVRLRHPGSVPKSAPRFASLPPPPSTRLTGVAATSAAPDFTD